MNEEEFKSWLWVLIDRAYGQGNSAAYSWTDKVESASREVEYYSEKLIAAYREQVNKVAELEKALDETT